MSYYNGSANSLNDLRQALIDACVLEGWTWDSGQQVLYKGPVFFRIRVVSGYLAIQGRTSLTEGTSPATARIGRPHETLTADLTWPVAYEIFAFEDEIFLVINYSVDFYQWAAFGKSVVSGLPGTGAWFGASIGTDTPSFTSGSAGGFVISTTQGGNALFGSGALFWDTYYSTGRCNCMVHSALDEGDWLPNVTGTSQVGISAARPLITLLPNNWNSEAVLLPLRAYRERPSSKASLTADLVNARHTRIDNYEPGQIVTLGDDRWKIFPWYRKSLSGRSGTTGASIDHTGTLGWAIRYEGP